MMKTKNIIITLLCVPLLNSCIVKSLQPFYTENTIAFQEGFAGEWKDNKNGHWKILSIKNDVDKEEFIGKDPSHEDLEVYKTYKEGYLVEYTKKEKKGNFIAMPFKVNNQLFLNFTPLSSDDLEKNINALFRNHLLSTHSLVKFDILDDGTISVNWLSESRIEELVENNQIRIKYEIVGIMEEMVLTATSEELVSFLKKYSKSTIKNKWESTSKFNLKRIDAKP